MKHGTGLRRLATVGVTATALGLSIVGAGPAAWAAHKTSGSAKVNASTIKKELRALTAKVKAGKGRTFSATYVSTYGGTNTLAFAQDPPKFLMKTGTSSVIDTGSQTLLCSTSGGQPTCISESGGTNPLASLEDLFSPKSALAFFSEAEARESLALSGYHLAFSSATFAGQPSKCVTVGVHGVTSKDCVTGAGLLAYVSTSGGTAKGGAGYLKLTGYSAKVPSSDFSPPPGATVETLPSGIGVP